MLFGDMLAASLERVLTPNLFSYRISMGTEDAILRIREGIIREGHEGKEIAIISWDIKGTFEDLPHGSVLKLISNSGASVRKMDVIKSYLRSQASYVQVGEAKSEIIKNRARGIGQGTDIAGPILLEYITSCNI